MRDCGIGKHGVHSFLLDRSIEQTHEEEQRELFRRRGFPRRLALRLLLLDLLAKEVLVGLHDPKGVSILLTTNVYERGNGIAQPHITTEFDVSGEVAAKIGQGKRMPTEVFDRRSKIRADVEAMLDKIQGSLHLNPSVAPLFTIRWEVL
jgi:hypothetical protein